MMQPLSPSCSPYEEMINSNLDQFFDYNNHFGDYGLSSIFNTSSEHTSSSSDVELNFSTPFHHTHMHNNIIQYKIDEETLHLQELIQDFPIMELDQNFDPITTTTTTMMMMNSSQNSCVLESQGSFQSQPQNFSTEEYASSPTPSMKSELSSIQNPIQNQLILHHLIEACKEALENGQKALAEEILRCISQKVSPIGDSFERFAFYFSQNMTNFGSYLKTEALKNFVSAYRAFYQGIPYGKIAHFSSFSAIIESVPQDCDTIHIFESYLGLGIQLILLIEAMKQMNRTLKIKYTSIKRVDDENPEISSTSLNFDVINRELCEYARSCGLNLKVEEKEIEEVVFEIKKMNKRGIGKKVFLAFNCMVGLPHMGKIRSRRSEVMEFLSLAKDLIKSSGNKGIITFCDGDSFEKLKNCMNFSSFFEGQFGHYNALLESIESSFPTSFSEARTAMECLFVAPNVSPFAWLEKFEEMKSDYNCCFPLGEEIGFEGYRFSKNTLLEVKEMLRGSEGSYEVRIEGQNGNELVLGWKGTELVRISAWRN